jgi:hypothetical protein
MVLLTKRTKSITTFGMIFVSTYALLWFQLHRSDSSSTFRYRTTSQRISRTNYTFTAIILHWNRLSGIRHAFDEYKRCGLFQEIIIWNNNPKINLTLQDISNQTNHSLAVRIINLGKNLKDEAKYHACSMANGLVCLYADDDWDISKYIHSLHASFLSDPNIIHSATNVPTYYNNLQWSYVDQSIDLHAGFSWIGSGSVFLRTHAERHLKMLNHFVSNQTGLIV